MCPAITMVLTGIVVFLAAEVSAHAQRITNCDPPGSTLAAGESINNAGAVTGWYQRTGSSPDGFIRDARGTFISFDVPGATDTVPFSINNAGAVTGHYADGVGFHGFIRR